MLAAIDFDKRLFGFRNNPRNAQSSQDKVQPEGNLLKESKPEGTIPVQQDLPLESCELYENRLSLDFYNYYNGTNFYKFVDFRDVYLNGSMEELKNWNALRNNKRLLQEKYAEH